jgi:hypothetical protein
MDAFRGLILLFSRANFYWTSREDQIFGVSRAWEYLIFDRVKRELLH